MFVVPTAGRADESEYDEPMAIDKSIEDLLDQIKSIKKRIEELEKRTQSLESAAEITSGKALLKSLGDFDDAGRHTSVHGVLHDDAKPGVYIVSYNVVGNTIESSNRVDFVVFSPLDHNSGGEGTGDEKKLASLVTGRESETGTGHVAHAKYSTLRVGDKWQLRVGVYVTDDAKYIASKEVTAEWVHLAPASQARVEK